MNLYGAPEFKDKANIVTNIKRFADSTKTLISMGVDPKEVYNHTPQIAPVFKGRVLINCRIEDNLSEAYEKKMNGEIKPFRRNIKNGNNVKDPVTALYTLKAIVVTGSELPAFIDPSRFSLIYLCVTFFPALLLIPFASILSPPPTPSSSSSSSLLSSSSSSFYVVYD